MSRRMIGCCIALFLVLTCASAAQKLNSIKDLKKINFGQSVPKHSLILLYWFANTIEIDNNEVVRLNFDPESDYGSHHYGNFERMLDPLPRGYKYYTIGNLNRETSEQFPHYVVHPLREYEGSNRNRIIIRVREQRIDQVYITQHYETYEQQGTIYDPAHTYQIMTNLLRQIREFSLRDNQLPLLYLRNRYGSNADEFYIKNKWHGLACLGLFLYIVIEEKYASHHRNNRPSPMPSILINNNQESNRRLESNNSSESSYRQESSSYNVEYNSYILERNSSPENRRRHCCFWTLGISCLIILALVIVLLIYFLK